MKVIIRNLGVISEAEIDLKPLTVFVGPNNSGKTWLAYALAGILGPFGSAEYVQAYAYKKIPNTYEPLDNAIERVLTEGNATIDLRRFADEYGETYFNDVAQYARNWMHRFLSTQLAHFDNMEMLLTLAETKTDFLDQISKYQRTNRVAGSVLTIRKSQDDDKVFAFTSTEGQSVEGQDELLEEKIPLDEVRERLVSFIATALRRSLYPQIRVFPTERTTLVAARFAGRVADRIQTSLNQRVIDALDVLVKELDMRELAEQNNVAREAIWPVSSFLSMLNTIFRKRSIDREEREKNAERVPAIKRFIQLAEILEKQILTGSIYLSTPEPDPRREVLFQPSQDVNLEIPIASSMVKELSPLVLYLRHLALPGEILIIDEPEMNLHPEAQAKIVEFLAMLVNAGLRVLITTHSPYIVDHLANLMKASEYRGIKPIAEIRDEFFLKRTQAFIAKEHVSTYLIDQSKVKNILGEDGLIYWDTFSDISDRVTRIYSKLL